MHHNNSYMKKKRLTAAQKKIAELTNKLESKHVDAADYRVRIDDLEKQVEKHANTIKVKDDLIANAKRILSVIPGQGDIAPDHMHLNRYNRGEMLSDSDNLISLAICAVTKVSEYRGKEQDQREVRKAAILATVNLSEERKQIIRVAVEQPQKYTVVTNPDTGLVEVYSREQGSRNIL
jgi:small-conductance mechanosensitive channel